MSDEQKPTPRDTAKSRPFAFIISIGLLLGALMMQWSNLTADQQKQHEDRLFVSDACVDHFPPPWRTQRTGHSAELLPSIRQFGLPACESIEFRPSTCNDEHFLVRCYAESERKGLWKVYRIELESETIFSLYPDLT